jgi:hypothetical protein
MKTIWKIAIGVLIIICLFFIYSLFLNFGNDREENVARFAQSQAYWRSATPFAILEFGVTASTGQGAVTIQNRDPTHRLTLTKISVGYGVNATRLSFEAGETKTISIAGIGAGAAGQVHELSVAIEY